MAKLLSSPAPRAASGAPVRWPWRRAGAQVLVHYSSNEKEADAVVAEIRKGGGKAEKVGADLRKPDGAHTLAKQVRAIVGDRLDILVANAGISKAATIEDTTVEDFDNLFAVNARAPFFLVQQLLPALCKGSNIIFTSSLAARASVGTLYAYAATKGAVETLVKHFAAALGPRGIRVNAVAPGVVETEMSNFTKTEAGREVTLGMQALKRVAQPDDIAPVVAVPGFRRCALGYRRVHSRRWRFQAVRRQRPRPSACARAACPSQTAAVWQLGSRTRMRGKRPDDALNHSAFLHVDTFPVLLIAACVSQHHTPKKILHSLWPWRRRRQATAETARPEPRATGERCRSLAHSAASRPSANG